MSTICMKIDPGMHIGLHLVFFGKTCVKAPVVAAYTSRIAVRDDLPVTTSAVATLRGSTSCCPSTVGFSR
jgi:hypothetical protein